MPQSSVRLKHSIGTIIAIILQLGCLSIGLLTACWIKTISGADWCRLPLSSFWQSGVIGPWLRQLLWELPSRQEVRVHVRVRVRVHVRVRVCVLVRSHVCTLWRH